MGAGKRWLLQIGAIMKPSTIFRLTALAAPALAALGFSAALGAADADAARATARQNNCFRCHSIEKDKDVPAWSKVAAKYKGNPNAEARLHYHLTSGEKAKFPDGHEEEHTIVKTDDENEIKNLVDWILSL